jgi:hypothetical protein
VSKVNRNRVTDQHVGQHWRSCTIGVIAVVVAVLAVEAPAVATGVAAFAAVVAALDVLFRRRRR